jgi:ElaB/YqjD/DUF883 family membrane-anchored ribosome-binding protein
VATEQDAARDRVLAARAEFEAQVEQLGASGRAAVDIPARVRESPAKAAAIVGAVGFLALKGPQRIVGAVRRAIWGEREPMPKRMLPPEVEKTLRKLGDDGEKVGAALERDFADYARKAHKEREGFRSIVLLAVVRPLLGRAAKTVGDALFSSDSEGVAARLKEVRERAEQGVDRARESAERAGTSAQDRISAVRRSERGDDGAAGPADETAPTGI